MLSSHANYFSKGTPRKSSMSDFLQPFFLALLSNIPHLSKGFYDFFHAIQLLVKEEKPIKYFLLHLLLVRFGKLLHDDPPNVIYGVHKVSIVTPRARSEANHERRVEQSFASVSHASSLFLPPHNNTNKKMANNLP